MSGRRHLAIRAVAAALCLGALGGPARAASTEPLDTSLPAQAGDLADYGACLAAAGEGELVILVDQSGSLAENDPDDARVAAATYLADRLADVTPAAGIALDVAVAGFDSDFRPNLEWTRLDGAGLPAVEAAVAAFATRDDGLDTDYWNALEGTRRALADRATSLGGGTRCQAIAWFSDGQLDIDPRRTDEQRERFGTTKPYAPDANLGSTDGTALAEESARTSLCRTGGLADQLRASGISLLGVGLVAGEASPQDFSLMRSITTGTDEAGATCGRPVDRPVGEFTLAADIDGLLFAFDAYSDPGNEPVQVTAGVCQAAVCVEEAHQFVLDDSISTVHVLGTSDVEGVRAVLVAPSGQQVSLDRPGVGVATDVAVADSTISFVWHSEHSLTIDMERPTGAPGWAGPWSLVFVDDTATSPDGVSRSSIHISGDLVPTLDGPTTTLRTGEVAPGFRLGLADATGAPVDPAALLGEAVAAVDLVSPTGDITPVASGVTGAAWAQELAVDLTTASPGQHVVRVTLAITTAPSARPDGSTLPGTALTPKRVDIPMEVLPPADFPSVGGQVDFGIAEGPARLSAALPVTGPGCVWLDAAATELVAFPEEAGDVSVGAQATGRGSCVEIAEGDERELLLELQTSAAGNGSVNGSVAVVLSPLDDDVRTTTVQVPFRADLRHPIDTARWWLGFVLALVLGPGLPIGLLYLVKYLGARIPPRALHAAAIEVAVRDGGVLRDGAPFALRDADLVELVRLSARGARTTEAAGLTLRTTIGRSPFGPPGVVVDAPGRIGASSTHPRPYGRARRARLPLAVHNTWAVLVDPAEPADRAVVLVLVGADASTERRRALVDDINRRVSDCVRDLRQLLEQHAPASGESPAQQDAGPAVPDPFGAADAGAAPSSSPWLGDPYDFSERRGDQP